MSYDNAEWHYGGDYPDDLPPENGGTHIGIFLAWCIANGLLGEMHGKDSAEAVAAVKGRTKTGREFLFEVCDESFTDQDLSDTGNAFAKWYYDGGDDGDGLYMEDYQATLCRGLASMYHVPDTCASYDTMAPVIARRFAAWKTRTP